MFKANDSDSDDNYHRLWVLCDNQKVYEIGNGVIANESTYTINDEFDVTDHNLVDTMA